jgi:hypothetical protein
MKQTIPAAAAVLPFIDVKQSPGRHGEIRRPLTKNRPKEFLRKPVFLFVRVKKKKPPRIGAVALETILPFPAENFKFT